MGGTCFAAAQHFTSNGAYASNWLHIFGGKGRYFSDKVDLQANYFAPSPSLCYQMHVLLVDQFFEVVRQSKKPLMGVRIVVLEIL